MTDKENEDNENEFLPWIKKTEEYNEEYKTLIKSRKKDMIHDLYRIIDNLKEKNDIDEFIKTKIDNRDKTKIFYSDIKDFDSEWTAFFLVKIIGFLFLTSYIVGIFHLIGIKESLEEEALDSIKAYINGNTTNTTNTTNINFYQKVYSNNTKKLPGLSFFFIASFLSNIIIKIINFPVLTIIMLILNGVVLFFLYNFDFLEGENLNDNYSSFDLFLLILYVIYFNLILGIVALIPMNIFSTGYFYYEQKLINRINAKNKIVPLIIEEDNKIKNIINDDNDNNDNENENENLIKSDIIEEKNITDKKNINNISITKFCFDDNNNEINTKKENVSDIYVRDSSSFFLEINDLKKEKMKEPENKEIKAGKYNGYYISYILAFIIAIVIRLYSNKENIIQDHIYLYFNLIYFHFIPIIISLFFYFIFSCAFTKNEENKSEICLTRFCGYLIFKEEKERKKSITCAGCRIGFRKCYKANMCCCCVCKCLECESCCCKEKDDLTEINDRDKAICICYKLSGKCSWICEYFSNNYIMLGVWVITIFEVFNFGFKSLLADYIKELDYQRNYSNPEIKENIFTIHIVFLIGIIFCYLFNLISGSIFYKKCDFKRFAIKGEDTILGA